LKNAVELLSGTAEQEKAMKQASIKVVVLLSLLICAGGVFGADSHPAMSFERVMGGSDLDRGVFVSPTKDGGYIAVGVTKSFGKGDEDVFLVRTDSSGRELWSRTFGGEKGDRCF
jgi:hypothetical protein